MAVTSPSTIQSAQSAFTASQTTTADKAATSGSSTSGASTASAMAGLGDNFNTFLKLLTTQMKNQDPTKPMDTNEMTQQLVQFANVEQQIGTNSRLDQMIKLQQGSNMSSNLLYLGYNIEYPGNAVNLTSGTAVNIDYKLDKAATAARIDITDSTGKVVRSLTGDTAAGTKNTVSWDGNDSNGKALATGSYTASVSAAPLNTGDTVTPTLYTTGKVTGVDVDAKGNPVLKVGKTNVSPSDVLAIQ